MPEDNREEKSGSVFGLLSDTWGALMDMFVDADPPPDEQSESEVIEAEGVEVPNGE